MGYYTNFKVTVYSKDENGTKIWADNELQMKLARRLCEISDWFDLDDLRRFEDSPDPFEELIGNDCYKWYDHETEMTDLSEAFPNLYFELHGHGEDEEDFWMEYFHNGESFHADAHITYDKPDWEDE